MGCLIHSWGPWRGGIKYETYNGVRTGRTIRGQGRECTKCGARQVR